MDEWKGKIKRVLQTTNSLAVLSGGTLEQIVNGIRLTIADFAVFCPKRGFETISAFDDRGRAGPVPGLSALKILVKVRQDRPREC